MTQLNLEKTKDYVLIATASSLASKLPAQFCFCFVFLVNKVSTHGSSLRISEYHFCSQKIMHKMVRTLQEF